MKTSAPTLPFCSPCSPARFHGGGSRANATEPTRARDGAAGSRASPRLRGARAVAERGGGRGRSSGCRGRGNARCTQSRGPPRRGGPRSGRQLGIRSLCEGGRVIVIQPSLTHRHRCCPSPCRSAPREALRESLLRTGAALAVRDATGSLSCFMRQVRTSHLGSPFLSDANPSFGSCTQSSCQQFYNDANIRRLRFISRDGRSRRDRSA